MIRVTVWNEFWHEKNREEIKRVYPEGIHSVIAKFLQSDDITVRCATLDDEECGLSEEVIKNTDVLIWWGHQCHGKVPDEIAMRVRIWTIKWNLKLKRIKVKWAASYLLLIFFGKIEST